MSYLDIHPQKRILGVGRGPRQDADSLICRPPVTHVHAFVTDALPYVMAAVMAMQGWMLKQIVDLTKWRARQEEMCRQHGIRDSSLERQMPVALKVLGDHGSEMETIRTTVIQLEQRIVDGFAGIDTRLDKLDDNHTALLQLIPKRENES